MTPEEDLAAIQLALRVAADTRLTDLCNDLGLSTIDAGNLVDHWEALYEDMDL